MKLKNFLFFLLVFVAIYSQNSPPQNITKALGKVSSNFQEPKQTKQSISPLKGTKFITCCQYHWIFAIDASSSMTSSCIWFVYYLRWVFRQWFFDPINSFLPCKQRVSTFGFNHRITPPVWGSYESLSTVMNEWLPPIADLSSFTTNFNLAIIKALTLVWESFSIARLNSCIILVSDGGTKTVDIMMFWIVPWVRNYMKQNPWNRCLCTMCFYCRPIPPPMEYNFRRACQALGAPIYTGSYSDMAATLLSKANERVFNRQFCQC